MKRNKTNHKTGGGGVSPYKRHAKTPYRYSETYYRRRASITGKRADQKDQ